MVLRKLTPIPRDKISSYISKSHWSIKKVINPDPEPIVSATDLKKILKWSGLNENQSNTKSLIDSLNLQLSFIKSLYKDGECVSASNNDKLFRLIKSDNRPGRPLTLEMLEEQVRTVGEQVDAEKGEIGFKKDGFFVTKG